MKYLIVLMVLLALAGCKRSVYSCHNENSDGYSWKLVSSTSAWDEVDRPWLTNNQIYRICEITREQTP